MSSRPVRRAAAHRALKAAQKAARKVSQPAAVAAEEINASETIAEETIAEEKLAEESLAAETSAEQTLVEEINPEPELESTSMSAEPASEISAAQLAANRANSLKSTGPRSPEAKAKVSLNAVKSGLTGRTIVLPSDDADLYQAHLRAFERICAPVGHLEACLTQTLADTQWRLDRIQALETALFSKGPQEFSDLFKEESATNNSMIDLYTATVYEKQFRNFHIQDSRLERRYRTTWAQLMALQKARLPKNKPSSNAPPPLTSSPHKPANPSLAPELALNFQCAGINRHEVGNERVLQERRGRIHPNREFCAGRREAAREA